MAWPGMSTLSGARVGVAELLEARDGMAWLFGTRVGVARRYWSLGGSGLH